MIQITCDRCDKSIEVPESHAGGKYACPHCGDINRVPSVESGESAPASAPAPSAPQRDRAAEAGYPPDSGDEQTVMRIRRCWFRSRPIAFSIAALFFVGGIVGAIWSGTGDHSRWVLYLWGIASLAGLGTIVWWWIDRFGSSLVITNKRTVQHTGLLRRATSEVVHDNIRNIQVDQSFWQRLWGVGRLGISSSGQDGVEIEINHLPGPDKLREIVDLYRPL
ncbi:MAG: PH domain-containing protein [Phycisphaerales bacterium]